MDGFKNLARHAMYVIVSPGTILRMIRLYSNFFYAFLILVTE
jgi:hypothetical protein